MIRGRVLGSDVATQRKTSSRVNISNGLTVVFLGRTCNLVRPKHHVVNALQVQMHLYSIF